MRTAEPSGPGEGAVPGRMLFGLALIALYALASHWLMVHAAHAPWAVAALLGPLLLMGLAGALQQRSRLALAALAAAAALLAGLVARGGVGSIDRLYVLQHVGIHLALGASFAATLRSGQLSMIGRFAMRVHGALSPAKLAYTRRVTRVWCGYFFGMAGASLWVYLAAPWPCWSLLANVGTPVGIALLFVGEYLLRYRLHPEFERISLASTLRAAGAARPGPGGADEPMAPSNGPGARP